MFTLKGNLKFININQSYLKYLHDACPEIYYKSTDYETKPYLGILLNHDGREYVIPLSSAKEKHKTWKNVDADRFLIYENCKKDLISEKAVFTENKDGTVKHILSIIDLKKMLPIKSGLYSFVDFRVKTGDTDDIKNYKNLLQKEYSFCLKIIDSILTKATKLYDRQMRTGKIIKFCADFKLLEQKCDEWS